MLNPKTLLRRTASLIIAPSEKEIVIELDGETHPFQHDILMVLETFSPEQRLENGVRTLKKRFGETYDPYPKIERLIELGILHDAEQEENALSSEYYGYTTAAGQALMLRDRQRTAAYVKAIQQVVRPGDVVVEIGTGTGVLTVAAAKAGAKRIYTIEASQIAYAAEQMFIANGVADRITVLRGYSIEIELPERADVMISELIGNDPFAEGAIGYTNDAIRRFLKPDARFVPHHIRVYALPVEVPSDVLNQTFITDENLSRWTSQYGFDFSPFQPKPFDSQSYVSVSIADAAEWRRLGAPALVASVPLDRMNPSTLQNSTTLQIEQAGMLNGVIIYFELDLGQEIISSEPLFENAGIHWTDPLFICAPALPVNAGTTIAIDYSIVDWFSQLQMRKLES